MRFENLHFIRMLMHYFASARFGQWLFYKSESLVVWVKTWVLNSVPCIGGLYLLRGGNNYSQEELYRYYKRFILLDQPLRLLMLTLKAKTVVLSVRFMSIKGKVLFSNLDYSSEHALTIAINYLSYGLLVLVEFQHFFP